MAQAGLVGCLPLGLLCSCHGALGILAASCNAGAAPPPQGDNCALHWVAMRGHVEIVKFLLQSGADRALRNKQDKVGQAGLQGACNGTVGVGGRAGGPAASPQTNLRAMPPTPCRYACRLPHQPCCRSVPLPLQIPIDLCQPTWSNAYRFTREVLAES